MASLTHLFRTFQSAQVAFWRKARHSQPLCALRAAPMLALMAAITLVSGVSHAQWVQTGFPSTASSYSMVAKEGNLFLATWGNGVYESTDGGADWTAVNNGLDQWFYTHYVYALAVVPSTSGAGTNLFAGMEEGGIWRSTDDGASWTWVYPGGVLGQHDMNFFALGVAGSTVVGGVRQSGYDNGVYRSQDDGVTWTHSNAGFATAADSNICCFTSIRVGGTTYLYVGTDGGLFLSTTEGAGWTRISSGLPANLPIISLIAVPSPGGGLGITLLAGVYRAGLFRSTDNGSSWALATNGFLWEGTGFGPALYVDALAASPGPSGTGTNIFAAAHPSVYVSTDYGAEWGDTGWPVDSASSARFLCINGGTLFGGSTFQIWKYPAALDSSWIIQLSGTADTLYCVKAVDNNVVWTGGTKGGVLLTTNGGELWTSVGGGTLGSDTVNAVEPLDANSAYVSTYSNNTGRIFKTTNGGSSWSPVMSKTGVAFGGIQMKTALEGYAVGSPAAGKWNVLRTTDGGGTWNSVAAEPAEDSLTGLAENYYGPYVVRPIGVQLLGDTLWFGSLSGKVYRSTNLGATWTTGTSVLPLSALHFNSSTFGLSGSSYGDSTRSTLDGGTSWSSASVTGTLGITCISGSGGEFWATTGRAIAYTKSAGQTWSFSSPGYWGVFARLNAVSFSPSASPLNGWAVGDSGMILHYQRGGPTSVSSVARSLPAHYSLEQNYPNPFNPTTEIRYQVSGVSDVKLAVYDLLGREVALLVNERKAQGSYTVQFKASGHASGVYLYRLQAGDFVQTRKMIFVK